MNVNVGKTEVQGAMGRGGGSSRGPIMVQNSDDMCGIDTSN